MAPVRQPLDGNHSRLRTWRPPRRTGLGGTDPSPRGMVGTPAPVPGTYPTTTVIMYTLLLTKLRECNGEGGKKQSKQSRLSQNGHRMIA